MSCKAHGLCCNVARHAVHLEEDAARLDDGNPVLGRALAGSHAGLCRLRCNGLIRENLDPDLSAALDVTRHRDTGSLDLAICNPCRLQSNEAVLTMADRVAALCLALHASAELLAVLYALWE